MYWSNRHKLILGCMVFEDLAELNTEPSMNYYPCLMDKADCLIWKCFRYYLLRGRSDGNSFGTAR